MSMIALSGSARPARTHRAEDRRACDGRSCAGQRPGAAWGQRLHSPTWPGLPGGCRSCRQRTASRPRLKPLSRGTADTALASLLAAVAESAASRTWDRLKICRNLDCREGLLRLIQEQVAGLVGDGRLR